MVTLSGALLDAYADTLHHRCLSSATGSQGSFHEVRGVELKTSDRLLRDEAGRTQAHIVHVEVLAWGRRGKAMHGTPGILRVESLKLDI